MAHVYRNLPSIPIPQGASKNRGEGRVFFEIKTEPKLKRITIGALASDTTMYPNDNFARYFPEAWEQHYGKKGLYEGKLSFGMYAASLAIGYRTGCYPEMHDTFGPLNANAMMDYAMYSIISHSNVTSGIQPAMAGQVTFSTSLPGDSWYSRLFKDGIDGSRIHGFRIRWAQKCAREGCRRVWLCIDGSNIDSAARESVLAEHGRAKSHRNADIISYIWAVNAEDGRPVTWFVNRGGMVDSKAVKEMVHFLDGVGVGVEGFILDRGFCTLENLSLIRELGYQYVIMLTSATGAYKDLLQKYAKELPWQMGYLIGEKSIFGVGEKLRVFATGGEEACVGFFYDGVNGPKRANALIEKVMRAYRELKSAMQSGKEQKVPKGLESYIHLDGDGRQAGTPSIDRQALQHAVDRKGFYAIASSLPMDAIGIHDRYSLRSHSETAFSAGKTQLGNRVMRVHSDSSIESKFCLEFIASILRCEIKLAGKALGLDANSTIKELNLCYLTYVSNGTYAAVDNLRGRQLALLESFGLAKEDIQFFAQEVNRRIGNKADELRRTLPGNAPKPRMGRPPKARPPVDPDAPKRRPGRPKGAKNRKTLEREALEVKRGPGRPKGSKNKPKPEVPPVKRPRGRPAGSKNKKTLEREAMMAGLPPVPKRPRGRPRKNPPVMQSPDVEIGGTQSLASKEENLYKETD